MQTFFTLHAPFLQSFFFLLLLFENLTASHEEEQYIEHPFHTGVMCFHQDQNDIESWLRKACDKIVKACDENVNEQCEPHGSLELKHLEKQLKRDDTRNYMLNDQYRMIVVVNSHGSCPVNPKVGDGDWRGCGGKVGPYKMTNFIKMWRAFYLHRLNTLSSESLLVVNACFSGCIINSDEYREQPFPLITTKGEASGRDLASKSHLILDPFVELMSRRVIVSKPLLDSTMSSEIKTKLIPLVKILRSNERKIYTYPGLIIDTPSLQDEHEQLGRGDSNFGIQVVSPIPFSFPDWNLDPDQFVCHGRTHCNSGGAIYSLEFNMDGRFHQQPVRMTANTYTDPIIKPPDWGNGHKFILQDQRIDLDPLFLGYDRWGMATFLALDNCQPRQQGKDVHVKIYYDIEAIYLFKLKSNEYVQDYAYETTNLGQLCSSPKRLVRSNHECYDLTAREGIWEDAAIATIHMHKLPKGCLLLESGIVFFNDIEVENSLNDPTQINIPVKSFCRVQHSKRDMVWTLGNPNTLCPAATKIKSLGECRDALDSLGINDGSDGVQELSGGTEEFPSGCTYEREAKAIHWNVYEAPAMPKFEPVCRVPREIVSDDQSDERHVSATLGQNHLGQKFLVFLAGLLIVIVVFNIFCEKQHHSEGYSPL